MRWRGFGEEEDSWEPANGLAAATDAVEVYRENTASLKVGSLTITATINF